MLQNSITIETERLQLFPMTYDFVSKIINNDSNAYAAFGLSKTEAWHENTDVKDILPKIQDNLRGKPKPDGFDGWLFISKKDNTIVGDGGFKGRFDENGIIDIGYAIVETQRRKGFAIEAVSALLKWGLSQDGVTAVTANCLDDNIPSIKILSKLGMNEVERKDGMIFFRISNLTV